MPQNDEIHFSNILLINTVKELEETFEKIQPLLSIFSKIGQLVQNPSENFNLTTEKILSYLKALPLFIEQIKAYGNTAYGNTIENQEKSNLFEACRLIIDIHMALLLLCTNLNKKPLPECLAILNQKFGENFLEENMKKIKRLLKKHPNKVLQAGKECLQQIIRDTYETFNKLEEKHQKRRCKDQNDDLAGEKYESLSDLRALFEDEVDNIQQGLKDFWHKDDTKAINFLIQSCTDLNRLLVAPPPQTQEESTDKIVDNAPPLKPKKDPEQKKNLSEIYQSISKPYKELGSYFQRIKTSFLSGLSVLGLFSGPSNAKPTNTLWELGKKGAQLQNLGAEAKQYKPQGG